MYFTAVSTSSRLQNPSSLLVLDTVSMVLLGTWKAHWSQKKLCRLPQTHLCRQLMKTFLLISYRIGAGTLGDLGAGGLRQRTLLSIAQIIWIFKQHSFVESSSNKLLNIWFNHLLFLNLEHPYLVHFSLDSIYSS